MYIDVLREKADSVNKARGEAEAKLIFDRTMKLLDKVASVGGYNVALDMNQFPELYKFENWTKYLMDEFNILLAAEGLKLSERTETYNKTYWINFGHNPIKEALEKAGQQS